MEQGKVKLLSLRAEYCLGCKGCELACAEGKTRQSKNSIVPNIYAVQSLKGKQTAYCRHCQNAYCQQLCPMKAIQRVQSAIVINEEKCSGCGICEQGCPYGAISMINRVQGGKQKSLAVKCDLCMERQLNNKAPHCIEACPTKALVLREPNS